MSDFAMGQLTLPKNDVSVLGGPAEYDPFKVQPLSQQELSGEQPGALVERPSFAETAEAAFATEWSLSIFEGEREARELDPAFDLKKISEPERKLLYDGLDKQLWEEYDGAVSLDHALAIRKRLEQAQTYHNTLANAGGMGLGLRLTAALTDPITLGAVVATEGMAIPAILARGAKLSRAARIGITATGGGVSNAAAELSKLATDPYRDSSDVLMAFGAGMVASGAFASFMKNGDAVEDAFATAGRRLMTEPPATVPDGNLGAAAVGRPEFYLTANDEDLTSLWRTDRVAARAKDATGLTPFSLSGETAGQFDISAALLGSAHDGISAVSRRLVRNSSGRTFQEATALEIANTEADAAMTRYLRGAGAAFNSWAESKGYNALTRQSPNVRREFDDLVARAKRTPGFGSDPNVASAARSLEEGYNSWLTALKAHGIQGFDKIDFNPNYIQRLWKADAITTMEKRFGVPAVDRFLTQSLRSGSQDLTEDELDKIVPAIKKAILGGEWDVERMTSVSLSRGDVQKVREMIVAEVKAAGGDTAEAETDAFADDVLALLRNAEGRGNPDRAQRRLRFDETYASQMVDVSTGATENISFADFLENNATSLYEAYSRQAAGAIALAKTTGVKSQGELDSLLRRIRKTAPNYYEASDKGRALLDNDYAHLEMILRGIQGRSVDPNPKQLSSLKSFAANLRHYNFMRLMGSGGLAQLSDLGNALGSAGWSNALRGIPALKGIMRDAVTGRLGDDLADELEAATAVGTDRLLNIPSSHMDELGEVSGNAWLRAGARAVADVSLMNPLNSGMERIAVLAAVQNFGRNVLKEGSGWGAKRLALLGLNDKTAKSIFSSIQRHAEWTEGGLTGRRIAKLNLNDWDEDTAKAFTYALRRHVRIAIQKNDLGDLTPIMSNWLGKTLLQFRSFMQVAWSKQFLQGVHMRDGYTFQSWMGSMLFGGLSYVAFIHNTALGRDDREKFLAEKLTPAEIGKAAFQRAGFASLIPSVIDTGLDMTRNDPLFAFRTTGLNTSFLSGTTPVDLVDNLYKTGQGMSDIVAPDRRFNQSDLRAVTKLLPFQNFYAVKSGLNAISSALPEDRK